MTVGQGVVCPPPCCHGRWCCVSSVVVPGGCVAKAGDVGIERKKTGGGVGGAPRVGHEAQPPGGGVPGAGGVGIKRTTRWRCSGAGGIIRERARNRGGVGAAGGVGKKRFIPLAVLPSRWCWFSAEAPLAVLSLPLVLLKSVSNAPCGSVLAGGVVP